MFNTRVRCAPILVAAALALALSACNQNVTSPDAPSSASALRPKAFIFVEPDGVPPAVVPEAPKLIPLFVIGDAQPHSVGSVVNFWGPQWWQSNRMTGTVNPGVAAFKGYTTRADLTCGGTWEARAGMSGPPELVAGTIAVIVTNNLLKRGANITGDIEKIITVDQNGGYGPNAGHAGSGVVTSVSCTR